MKKSTLGLLFSALLTLPVCTANAQRITVTIAGTGIGGYSGDNGSSKLAQVNGPKDVCMDAAENIYFVDRANFLIRKISAQKGVITTIAGGGSSIVDGVPATTAQIAPNYMCMSASGNLYFTDDNEIKKINTVTGIITTVAGSTTAGYTGDNGPANVATLNNPQGIAIDASNNLYVVDRGNNVVRKISASSGIITTIAGNGIPGNMGDGGQATAAELHGPVCVAIDPTGNVFFSDQNPNYPNYDNSTIRKINISTGIVTTIAGQTPSSSTYDVPANLAILGTITGLCFAPDGDMYCNEMSCSCRKLNFTTDTLYLVGGNFYSQGFSDDLSSPFANMNVPYGLCLDHSGNVYIADSCNQRIRKIVPMVHTPAFVFGRGQYIAPTIGVAYSLDSLMRIADVDSGQSETWTVLTAPHYGTLAGFPTMVASIGAATTTKATGLSYTPSYAYTSGDFFRIRITDGTGLSDTVSVYVGPNGSGAVLGVNNAASATELSIFPNPATSVMNMQWTNLQTTNNNVVIMDVKGNIVYKAALANNSYTGSMQVDISSFASGIYFAQISGSGVQKFVKE